MPNTCILSSLQNITQILKTLRQSDIQIIAKSQIRSRIFKQTQITKGSCRECMSASGVDLPQRFTRRQFLVQCLLIQFAIMMTSCIPQYRLPYTQYQMSSTVRSFTKQNTLQPIHSTTGYHHRFTSRNVTTNK